MKNLIKKILKEQVSEKEIDSGFDEFYKLFKEKYGKTENFDEIFQELEKDIKKSPTPKITISDRGMFCGMSLTNNVIINKSIFSRDIFTFIYVLFHEIAHQYQYKKYGKDLLYELTTKEVSNESLDKLVKIEQVADRFGESMSKKYANMFGIPKQKISSPYSNIEYGKNAYKNLILRIQKEIEKGNITCVEQMESYMLDDYTRPYTPSYTYTGSSYGSYDTTDYKQTKYYDWGDSYEKSYSQYEKGEVEDMETTIKDTFEDELYNLKYEIGSELNDIIYEVIDSYGNVGANIFIDMLIEEGFEKFFNSEKIETDEEVDDMDELKYKIDTDFYSVIEDLKEFIEKKLQEMMDIVEEHYGWEGSRVLSELIDEQGFDDLWIEY